MSRKGIQQIQPDGHQQTSRKIPIPKKLTNLLKLVNLIPHNWRLQSSKEIDGHLFNHIESYPTDRLFLEAAISAYKDAISTLPEAVRDFIGSVTPKTFSQARERYVFLLDAKRILWDIARGDKKSISLPYSQELIRLEINPKGQIDIHPTSILEALTEPGVSVFRIRECPICSNIFWAGRIDQSCCSKQCSGVLRTRRWRNGYIEAYKHQRYKKVEGQFNKAVLSSPGISKGKRKGILRTKKVRK